MDLLLHCERKHHDYLQAMAVAHGATWHIKIIDNRAKWRVKFDKVRAENDQR